MVGATAIQRKILVLIYTLWKNDTVFDEEYEIKKSNQKILQRKAGSGISKLPAQDELKSNQMI